MLRRGLAAILRIWRLEGARGVARAFRRQFSWEHYFVRFRVVLAEWDLPLPEGGPLEVRPASLTELASFRQAYPGDLAVQFYEDQVHGARRPYVGLWEGNVAHISWVFTHEDRTPQIRLRPGEVEFNGAYTLPAYRGKGLLPMVERGMLRDLKAEGVKTAYTHVAIDNFASLRGVAKAGFRAIGIITWTHLLGLSFVTFDEGVVALPETASALASLAR